MTDPLFHQEILIGAVSVKDVSLRELLSQRMTATQIALGEPHVQPFIDEDLRQLLTQPTTPRGGWSAG